LLVRGITSIRSMRLKERSSQVRLVRKPIFSILVIWLLSRQSLVRDLGRWWCEAKLKGVEEMT
jgi:hypothetical protein